MKRILFLLITTITTNTFIWGASAKPCSSNQTIMICNGCGKDLVTFIREEPRADGGSITALTSALRQITLTSHALTAYQRQHMPSECFMTIRTKPQPSINGYTAQSGLPIHATQIFSSDPYVIYYIQSTAPAKVIVFESPTYPHAIIWNTAHQTITATLDRLHQASDQFNTKLHNLSPEKSAKDTKTTVISDGQYDIYQKKSVRLLTISNVIKVAPQPKYPYITTKGIAYDDDDADDKVIIATIAKRSEASLSITYESFSQSK